MFKIIGADQKEYGPVSTAQIRQWITDGRLSAVTQAQRATGGDWQPLSAFEEFADIFNPASAAPTLEGAPAPLASGAPAGVPLPTAAREMALSAVKAPAIGLIITGALGVAFYLYRAISVLSRLGHYPPVPAGMAPVMRSFINGMHGPGAVVVSVFVLVMNAVIAFGASRMMKLQSHSLAITTCILAIIPCCSGLCFLLGLVFGVWGIIALNKPEVKSQFQN